MSEDDDLVESQIRKGAPFPLRHRLLTNDEFSLNSQLESVLTSPAEVSALLQSHDGCRLDEAHSSALHARARLDQSVYVEPECPRVRLYRR